MKYFLHDTSAFDDEKITELYMNFGYEGLGLFYTILEKIAKQEKPIKTTVLKRQLNVGKKLEKCWEFMESIGIISSSDGETFNKQLLNYSKKYQIKKEKNKNRVSQWRDNQEDTENVTHYSSITDSVRNADKVKVSKVKVSKVKVDDETTPPQIDFLEAVNLPKEESPPVAPPPQIGWMSIDDCMALYLDKRYERTHEQICMSNHLNKEQFLELVRGFSKDLVERAVQVKTIDDYAKHFKFWLPKQLSNKNGKYRNNNSVDGTKRYGTA